VVRGYKIHYSTQDLGKGTANWESATSNQPTPNYLLTGLDPLRAYAIKVITDGRSSTSNNIKVLLQKKLAFIYSQTWKLLPPESWW